MKYFLRTISSIALIVVATGCQSTFSPKVDSILTKMRTKIDPQNKLPQMSSKVIKGKFRSNSKDKPALLTIKVQTPDLLRFEIIIPGEESIVTAYDGKVAWSFSTEKGYKDIIGDKLNNLKFQAAFLNPSTKPENIFSSIVIDGEEKVMEQICYKVICTPKKEFNSHPIIMFIDKKNHLLKKRIETRKRANGKIFEISTIMSNYKSFDGILVPQTIISYVNGNIMEYDVKSVIWNEQINISAFDPPTAL